MTKTEDQNKKNNNKKNHHLFTNKIKKLEEYSRAEDFFQAQPQALTDDPLADPYPIRPRDQQTSSRENDYHNERQVTEEEQWFSDEDNDSYEGQLAVDVYQDKKNIYIKAAIAGVEPEDIDIDLNNDMITIKGKRRHYQENIDEDDYYIKECYWGGFSRSIILPVDIQTDKVKATIKHGLLTIVLPKSKRPRHTKIKVQEEKK